MPFGHRQHASRQQQWFIIKRSKYVTNNETIVESRKTLGPKTNPTSKHKKCKLKGRKEIYRDFSLSPSVTFIPNKVVTISNSVFSFFNHQSNINSVSNDAPNDPKDPTPNWKDHIRLVFLNNKTSLPLQNREKVKSIFTVSPSKQARLDRSIKFHITRQSQIESLD